MPLLSLGAGTRLGECPGLAPSCLTVQPHEMRPLVNSLPGKLQCTESDPPGTYLVARNSLYCFAEDGAAGSRVCQPPPHQGLPNPIHTQLVDEEL